MVETGRQRKGERGADQQVREIEKYFHHKLMQKRHTLVHQNSPECRKWSDMTHLLGCLCFKSKPFADATVIPATWHEYEAQYMHHGSSLSLHLRKPKITFRIVSFYLPEWTWLTVWHRSMKDWTHLAQLIQNLMGFCITPHTTPLWGVDMEALAVRDTIQSYALAWHLTQPFTAMPVTKITTHSNRLYYLHIATSQTQPKHIYIFGTMVTWPQEAGAQH